MSGDLDFHLSWLALLLKGLLWTNQVASLGLTFSHVANGNGNTGLAPLGCYVGGTRVGM